MSLGRVVVAAAPVLALFVAVAWPQYGRPTARATLVCVGETAVLTLLAALWFGSLGSGGWWLVFLLVGVLVSGAERGLRFAFLRSPAGPETRGFLLGVARYVAAGALLAWRLS